jgi:hypothetical protein
LSSTTTTAVASRSSPFSAAVFMALVHALLEQKTRQHADAAVGSGLRG